MKKVLLFIAAVMLSAISFGQGLETLKNYPETSSTYADGTFTGQDGSIWTYSQCRGDGEITEETLMLGKDRTPLANLASGSISGGCGTLSFKYLQAFSTNVNLDVLINGNKVTSVISSGEQNTVKNSGPISVNVSGDFSISFSQPSRGGQVCIDDITWTEYIIGSLSLELTSPNGGESYDPGDVVNATWTSENIANINIDALTPNGWVKLNSDPIDATLGTFAYTIPINIWTGDTYKIRVSDVLDSDANDESDATFTINGHDKMLFQHTFDGVDFGNFITSDLIGSQAWNGTVGSYAEMNGYENSAYDNEDWLVTPSINLDNSDNNIFEFMAYYNSDGPNLKLFYTSTFSGDASASTWTEIPIITPSEKLIWEYIRVDISALTGSVYFGFKYTSNTTDGAADWRVNNIFVSGVNNTPTNIDNTSANISVFPNPFDTQIIVKANGIASVELINAIGQSVLKIKGNNLNEFTLPTSRLAKGIYIVKITEANGNVVTDKLMKK